MKIINKFLSAVTVFTSIALIPACGDHGIGTWQQEVDRASTALTPNPDACRDESTLRRCVQINPRDRREKIEWYVDAGTPEKQGVKEIEVLWNGPENQDKVFRYLQSIGTSPKSIETLTKASRIGSEHAIDDKLLRIEYDGISLALHGLTIRPKID